MTATISNHWLLAYPASKNSAYAIILHGVDSGMSEQFIQEIAEYLNEYDGDGEGRWVAVTRELMENIYKDSNHRLLLGIEDGALGTLGDPQSEFRQAAAALGRRGHVVFHSPGLNEEPLELSGAFHAGVGNAGHIEDPCHVILNPEFMDPHCISRIVGDVFLEWIHCQTPRDSPTRNIW